MSRSPLLRFATGVLCLLLFCGLRTPVWAAGEATAILTAQQQAAQAPTLQHYLEQTLAPAADSSTANWYGMVLAQAAPTLDFTAFAAAAATALADTPATAAVTQQRIALTLLATAPVDAYASLLQATADATIGKQGIMSWVFGLHLLTNHAPSTKWQPAILLDTLCAMQLADGGFALRGTSGDVDVTAMTLQALAPYVHTHAALQPVVARALAFLAENQLPSGGYASFGTENLESTAQVWIALSALGIDAQTDARFQAASGKLPDAIAAFAIGDGTYSHTPGGKPNAAATVQAAIAYTAYDLYRDANAQFFVFPRRTLPVSATTQPQMPATESIATLPAATTETIAAPENATTTHASNVSSDSAATMTTAHATTALSTASDTHRSAISDTTAPTGCTGTWRWWVSAALLIVAGGLAIRIWRTPHTKRQKRADTLWLSAGTVLCLSAVWLLRIETPAAYYQAPPAPQTSIGSVTLTIRCDTIAGQAGAPANAELLPQTVVPIAAGDTVLTALTAATRAAALPIEVDGISDGILQTAYVRGIADCYEQDFGDLSGWVYLVNGVAPAEGCGSCLLSPDDTVLFWYTLDLGLDAPSSTD